ncbi:MAG: hypothetical protein ACLQQ4_03110 [Bacteroidia bacterium]
MKKTTNPMDKNAKEFSSINRKLYIFSGNRVPKCDIINELKMNVAVTPAKSPPQTATFKWKTKSEK